MGEFINKPVRQLSLGQKMRAEIAGALLHEPSILYLDEPTIGLDVVAKSRMRDFIKQVNKELKTTVVITTHNMDDIEALCERLIMIDRGKILYDGSLLKFKEKYGGDHLLIVKFDAEDIKIEDPRLHLRKNEG